VPEPDPTAAIALGRQLGGRYELIRLVARGGMAEVYEGYDRVLSRPVAVKLLQPHLARDEVFRERFRREAVTAAQLAHPSIVATFDAGVDHGNAFIVMEMVRGATLRQLLSERGALGPALSVVIARQIADALAFAHRCGLVHRDVKPANVLVCEDGDEPRVKVTDFGIAKAAEALEGDLTLTGVVLGTPKYLSPEQLRGDEPDPRSDLYGLGVVLYEMLSGAPPFSGPTEMAVALAHLNDLPPPLMGRCPDVPASLDRLVRALLAKSPADRPPSAAVVRQELSLIAVELAEHAVSPTTEPPTPPTTELTAVRSATTPTAVSSTVVATGVPSVTPSYDHPAAPRLVDSAAGLAAGPATDVPRPPAMADRPSPFMATPPPGPPPVPPPGPPPGPQLNHRSNGSLDDVGVLGSDGDWPPRPPTDDWPRPVDVRALPSGAGTLAGPPPVRSPAPGPEATGRPPIDRPEPKRGPTVQTPGRAVGIVVGCLVVAGAVVAALLLTGHGRTPSPASAAGTTSPPPSPYRVTDVTVYMVGDRPPDNPSETPLTFDGNPATAWHTEVYTTPTFGNLYPGIGLAVQLDASHTLHQVKVTSSTMGWSAQTYVSAVPVPSARPLSSWGTPTDTRTDIAGSATFSLAGRAGQWVLLWITSLGPARTAEIAEISVT
jgi:serine/threonine-protein kinase